MKKIITSILAAAMLLGNTYAFAAGGTSIGGGPVNGSAVASGTISINYSAWDLREMKGYTSGGLALGSYAGGGPTLDENGDCLVPLWGISFAWGYTGTDDGNAITLINGHRTIVIPYEGNTAVIDGVTIDLPHKSVVPQYADWDSVRDHEIYCHYSYLPVVFGVENVEWNPDTLELLITDGETTPVSDAERQLRKSDVEFQKGLIAQNAASSPEAIPDEPKEDEPMPPTDNRSPFIGTPSQFSDIPDSASLLNACVNELVSMDIISGYEDGTFQPDRTITRAEAAAMICRLMNFEETPTNKFSDVPKNEWYNGFVGAIAEKGIVGGYEDGTFCPDKEITYSEILRIIYSILGQPALPYPSVMSSAARDGLTDELSSFTADSAVTRGNMSILLSKTIDSYITTWEIVKNGNFENGDTEMTLFDYLNGTYPLKYQYRYSL